MLLVLPAGSPCSCCEPHPDLVAVQPVTAADLMAGGLFPAERMFGATVPAEGR